jgi:hypothetical protein
MKSGLRIICTMLIGMIASLFICLPVLAVPQIPASFYGTVKVNGADIPDGTSVQALIDGKVYAEVLTQTYQGDSVYALNVTGDDTDTTAKDGGREGDTVQFKIGGVLANQTGVWHSGTNVELNLTVASTTPLATPMATLTLAPTQTAIPTLKPTTVQATPTLPLSATETTVVPATPVPATDNQISLTPTSPDHSSLTATGPIQTAPVSSEPKQPKPTSANSESSQNAKTGSFTTIAVIVFVILVVAMIIGYIIMETRGKKN